MTDKIKELLEKYNPESIFKTIEENCDPTKIHAGGFVTIDSDALNNSDIRKEITIKKGPAFLAQLDKICSDGTSFYVSALKTLRTTSGYLSEAPSSNNAQEADLIHTTVPGLFAGPSITVPTAILKMATAPNDIMQRPIDDKHVAKIKHDRGTEMENEYNKGKQPKGTRKAE